MEYCIRIPERQSLSCHLPQNAKNDEKGFQTALISPQELSSTTFVGVQIKGGIQGFREPKPAIVFVTSAGVERNARIGDDEVARKKDIPIVQLNPGGVLNHKYAGEWALRSAGVPYTIVRSTGTCATFLGVDDR